MIFDESDSQHLKPWLVRTLEPICDAEPGALADYILALLKHNVPEAEMRMELSGQLDEFLEKECAPFVNTLFNVLRTKSYLPYADAPASSSKSDTISIPVDAMAASSSLDRSRKRMLEDDDSNSRPYPKGPRLSSEGQFSRYGGRGGASTGFWNGPRGGLDQGRAYQPPPLPRGMCRDYHNNGFCMRGNTCKYSHGQDPILSENFMFPMGPGMPYMPIFDQAAAFGMDGGYDPHQSRMDMNRYHHGPQTQNRVPNVLPRTPAQNGSGLIHAPNASGELPVIQDLTPNSVERLHRPHPHPQNHPLDQHSLSSETNIPRTDGFDEPDGLTPMDVDGSQGHRFPQRGGRHGGGRGRGNRGPQSAPGTFNAEVSSLRPEKKKGLTLVVEKIPREKLGLEQVNEWFKRFGNVTNVAIDSSQAKALVSFATNEEAHAAWKSEDAVFGNRFVKVFWHRPMEGHGQKGTKMLAASAQAIANLATKEGSPAEGTKVAPSGVSSRLAPSTSTNLAAKQQLLEKQISEQKTLMASLASASAEEKKDIMARLRKLGEEMKTASPANGADESLDREQNLRDRLDKELELAASKNEEGGGESTESLKDQLEKLKAEAASLGLPPNGAESTTTAHQRGGFRGRARGRGFYSNRGFARGAYPRGNQKLDNRPKKLLVKGLTVDSDEGLQPLKDWYESTGQLDSVERLEDGSVVVAFPTRSSAEQALAKGTNIPTLGTVQLSWHTGVGGTPKNPPSQPSPPTAVSSDTMADIQTTAPVRPEPEEEELVSSGWGDGDGGMI